MFNPFEPFSFGLIDAFRLKCYRWLVAQSFDCDEAKQLGRKGLLLTPYHDANQAIVHCDARKADPMACIMDLEKEEHRKKLEELIVPLSRYNVWAGLVRDCGEVEKRLMHRYKLNVRRYIQNNTNWRIKGNSTINVSMKLIFGEVFLLMKYNSREEIQVKLEEVAKN